LSTTGRPPTSVQCSEPLVLQDSIRMDVSGVEETRWQGDNGGRVKEILIEIDGVFDVDVGAIESEMFGDVRDQVKRQLMLTISEYKTIVAVSYKDMIDTRLRVDQDFFALIAVDLKEGSFQSDLIVFIELVALYGPIGHLRQGCLWPFAFACLWPFAFACLWDSQSLKDRLNHMFQIEPLIRGQGGPEGLNQAEFGRGRKCLIIAVEEI